MIQLDILKEIGLNEKEAKVYLANLKLGPSSISTIAKQAKIKRTTVYEIMKSLLDQQLISITAKGKRKHYVATEPENLKSILEKKEELLSSILPQLNAMSQTSKTRPTIKTFEGVEGIKSIYEDTIKEKKDLYAFVDYAQGVKELTTWLDNEYIPNTVKNQIMAYVIAPDSKESIKHKNQERAEFQEIRLVPLAKYPFSIEINIYGNKIAFISFKANELFGVIIESPEISKTMKMLFDFFWEHSADKACLVPTS